MIDFLKIWLKLLGVLLAVGVLIAVPITLNLIGLPIVSAVVFGVYATGFLAWVFWAVDKYL